MALTIHKTIYSWFRPALVAIFGRNLPWAYRWRLLSLQPIQLLAYSIAAFPWLFSRAFTVEWLPVSPNLTLRALVFKSKKLPKSKQLRPLHLDIHGGAFLGGLPESDAVFCNKLAEETGAVVISTAYRYAPEHVFPTAIDDVDAVVKYLQEYAAERYGADPTLMTMSGFSAGATLALGAMQQESCHEPAKTAVKGVVTYYAPVDFRLPPERKPKPAGFPKTDPLSFLMPLFYAYASPVIDKNRDNPRLNPILASIETLPKDMLMIVPTMDILLHEQLSFLKRLQEEAKPGRRIESRLFEGQIHGWAELPSKLVGPTKMEAIDLGVSFLKEVYEKYGFVLDE